MNSDLLSSLAAGQLAAVVTLVKILIDKELIGRDEAIAYFEHAATMTEASKGGPAASLGCRSVVQALRAAQSEANVGAPTLRN